MSRSSQRGRKEYTQRGQSSPRRGHRTPDKGARPASERPQAGQRSGALIMGRNCVREVLCSKREIVRELYVGMDLDRLQQTSPELFEAMQTAGVHYQIVDMEYLSALVDSGSHQGVVAAIKDRQHPELKSLIQANMDKERSVVLVLDEMQDPQNLGTALRAAECFGVDAVVWSRNRGVAITPVVSKVSVGGSELVTSVPVANVVDALRKLKEANYWIVAAEVGAGSQSLFEFEFPGRVALVFGSEGEGLGRLVREQADYLVHIPQSGKIDSLNVSQAIAVFLAACRQGWTKASR